MSATGDKFLQLLDLMTSPMLANDPFKWVITHVTLLESGPSARWQFDWHSPRPGYIPPSHDSFACMTLRFDTKNMPVLMPETCTMGKPTTDAMQALNNRFVKAARVVLKAG